MPALDFPNSPTTGTIFDEWRFDGTKWVSVSGGPYVPLAGGTMTGPLVLSGNATASLNPVALQQLQAGYLPLSGGTVSGNLTVSGQTTAHQLVGVTDGSNAAAGQVGEFLTASASNVNLPNNTSTTVVSLVLSAGDWDLSGWGALAASGGNMGNIQFGLSTSPASMGTQATGWVGSAIVTNFSAAAAPMRQNLTASTTIYLSAYAGFTAGTASAYGMIYARRMR